MTSPEGSVEARYASGPWLAIAGVDAWLLIDADAAAGVVQSCWDLFRRGGKVDEVLTLLAREGLQALGSFVLVGRSQHALRVVARGEARAEVHSLAGETVTVGSDGAVSWSEHLLTSFAKEIRLLDGTDSNATAWMPLSGGVTLASAVSLVCLPAGLHPMPDSVVETATDPESSVATPPAEAAEIEVAEPVERTEPEELMEEDMPVAEAPSAEAPSFDHLFGATVPPATEHPDVLAAAPAKPSKEAAVADAASLDSPRPFAATLAPTNTDYPISSPGIIDSVPWLNQPAQPVATPEPAKRPEQLVEASGSPPPPPPQPVAEASDVGDSEVAAATISRSAILAGASAGAAGGPTVLAARCPSGHLGPAYADRCRVCRQFISPQEPFMTVRPLLGVLRSSNGDVVPLDRGVLAGRAPTAPDVTDRERPHVLALASPPDGISRTHLEVRLDGWQVLVVDLGSTNGTMVTPPNQDSFKLRERDPVLIEPGTTINLADVVTFTFEVGA